MIENIWFFIQNNIWLFIGFVLIVIFIFGFTCFYLVWQKFSKSKDTKDTKESWKQDLVSSFSKYARSWEIFGVLIVVIAFFHEFTVEKPRERAVRNAQLFAQVAELAKDENKEAISPAVKNIIQLLANENVNMKGIALPEVYLNEANLSNAILARAYLAKAKLIDTNLSSANLKDANLSNAILGRANLSNANLGRANLSNANLISADINKADLARANLSHAILAFADLSNANLYYANLYYANLEEAKGLRQEQLELVKPTAPPKSLPDGLEWPFEQNDEGKWVKKVN